MDIMNFITENSLILVPALYIIGIIIKSTDAIRDKYIPLILLVIGIIGTVMLQGFNVQALIQGVLVTGAAVYTNQLIKQTTKTE